MHAPLERCKYKGLHRKLTSMCFVLDLRLICNELQELPDVNEELQFVSQKHSPGTFYVQPERAVSNKNFIVIKLYVKSKEDPMNAVVFYDHHAQSIEKRMLNEEDGVLANSACIVKTIKGNTSGEKDIEVLAVYLQETIKSFREYVFDNCTNLGENCENKSYPGKLLPLTIALKTIPI